MPSRSLAGEETTLKSVVVPQERAQEQALAGRVSGARSLEEREEGALQRTGHAQPTRPNPYADTCF